MSEKQFIPPTCKVCGRGMRPNNRLHHTMGGAVLRVEFVPCACGASLLASFGQKSARFDVRKPSFIDRVRDFFMAW